MQSHEDAENFQVIVVCSFHLHNPQLSELR